MKFTLLILVCLMASVMAHDSPLVENNSSYKWLNDIWVVNIDLFLILLCAPYFWILTFFANKPEKFVTFVNTFTAKKGFRLSYKYV